MSHNPAFNQSMKTGLMAERISPSVVDEEFGRITQTRMTMEGTTSKVMGMFLAVLVGAGVTWFFGLYSLAFPAMFVGLGLGLWAAFSKTVRPGVMMAYALVQGVFIGGISGIFEAMYPGIVQTAVIGTFATAGSMFAAYRFGWIKVDARLKLVVEPGGAVALAAALFHGDGLGDGPVICTLSGGNADPGAYAAILASG